jgi:hypothetical protein
MKQWKLKISVMVSLVLLTTACGSKGNSNVQSNGTVSPQAQVTTASKTEKNTNKNSEVLGELEVIGEKTKKIGRFEITLHSGQVVSQLKKENGKNYSKRADQLLILNATVKSIFNEKKTAYDLDSPYIFCGENTTINKDDLSCGTYTGVPSGLSNDLTAYRFHDNETQDGNIYFDVKKDDTYKIYYEDWNQKGGRDKDFWVVKVKK